MPARDEAPIIARAIARLKDALGDDAERFAVSVAVNGSTDQTAHYAREAGADVILLDTAGKGAAVRAAARQSSAEYFVFIDADLSADPRMIIPMVRMIERGESDIVIGSRLVDSSRVTRGAVRSFSSRVFNGVRRLMIGVHVADSQCGLKAMNARARDELRRCGEDGWFFDMEFLARAERRGLRICEIPVVWIENPFPERKNKLRMVRDGLGAVAAMVRIRRRLMAQWRGAV